MLEVKRDPSKKTAKDVLYQMALPEGKTCGDCRHFGRCSALIKQIAGDEVCDWSPSRFIANEPEKCNVETA
jgi:hypothetical protein